MTPAPPEIDLCQNDATDDAFLGGKLRILQPRKGYRAGVDPVLLAAAVSGRPDHVIRVLDVGAGVGTAGLCVAARIATAQVVLLERESALASLARANIARNELQDRVTCVEADIAAKASETGRVGIASDSFDIAIANPPYHADAEGTRPPALLKDRSHVMPAAALETWCRFLCRVLKPDGSLYLIHKPDKLLEILEGLSGRFGDITVLPLCAYAGEPAIRIIVRARKSSRAPLRLLYPRVLHRPDRAFEPWAEAIFRTGAGLAMEPSGVN